MKPLLVSPQNETPMQNQFEAKKVAMIQQVLKRKIKIIKDEGYHLCMEAIVEINYCFSHLLFYMQGVAQK